MRNWNVTTTKSLKSISNGFYISLKPNADTQSYYVSIRHKDYVHNKFNVTVDYFNDNLLVVAKFADKIIDAIGKHYVMEEKPFDYLTQDMETRGYSKDIHVAARSS